MITYTLPLAGMTLVQPCNGGGFNSGVSTVAQALAQPIGAVNTQFTSPTSTPRSTPAPGGADLRHRPHARQDRVPLIAVQ
jgi:hypothetical protein